MATEVAVAPTDEGEGGAEKKARAGIYFQAPAELKVHIDAEAQRVSKTPAVFVRDLLAERYGVTLPEAPTRSTYASDEERAAAQKAKRADRQALIKQLLQEHRAKLAEQKAA